MNPFVQRSIKTRGLNADLFTGFFNEPQRALIFLGGSEGGKSWNDHTEFIQQVVGLGYVVLSLAYFGAEGLPPTLRAIPLEYFLDAFHWLSCQPGIIPGGFGLVGVSRGAELALLLASHCPEVKAVVAIAPSSVVFPGPPTGLLDGLRGQHAAWSLNGQEMGFVPIPYTLTSLRGMLSGRRTRMFEQALLNASAVEAAVIPVEKIQARLLLVSFTQDQIWPSTRMADQVIRRLQQNDFAYPVDHQAFDTVHSNWSFATCRSSILTFLNEWLNSPGRDGPDHRFV